MPGLGARSRVAILAALAALAALLFVVFSEEGDSGDGQTDRAATQTIDRGTTRSQGPGGVVETLRVRDGRPVGGVREISGWKGERVRITIAFAGALPEEIHVHGYEITEPVRGRSLTLDFEADLDGIFEIEAHTPAGDQPLAELVVRPS